MKRKTISLMMLSVAVLCAGCATGKNDAQPDPSIHSNSSSMQDQQSPKGIDSENKESSEKESFNSSESSNPALVDNDASSVHHPIETGAASYRLDLEQSVQETAYWCGPTALQMVLHYHGISASQEELASELHTSSVTGTEYADLARVASEYIFGSVPKTDQDPGYREVLFKRTEADENERRVFEQRIVDDLRGGDPVFVSINNNIAYQTGKDDVHQIVVYGIDVDDSGRPVMYYYRDPSYLMQDEETEGKYSMSADEMWSSMVDNPEPGYVW